MTATKRADLSGLVTRVAELAKDYPWNKPGSAQAKPSCHWLRTAMGNYVDFAGDRRGCDLAAERSCSK